VIPDENPLPDRMPAAPARFEIYEVVTEERLAG
jgi:hypothetical protein